MSEPKFTHGPWTFDDTKEPFERPAIIAKGAERYGKYGPVCLIMKRHPHYISNARLIAAAPGFYEDEEKKLVYLRMLKKELSPIIDEMPFFKYRMLLRTVVQSLDIIANETEDLLAKARGEVQE